MNADEIKGLRDDIRAFVRECEEKQHTDTCAAHDLLESCEGTLGQLVTEITHMTKKAEHGCTDAYCPMCDG